MAAAAAFAPVAKVAGVSAPRIESGQHHRADLRTVQIHPINVQPFNRSGEWIANRTRRP